MGGFVTKEPPTSENGDPKVHIVTKRRLSGRPAAGSFSAGPNTMQKMRTRSDFCLLKIFEEETVVKRFGFWAEGCNEEEAVKFLSFIRR